MLTVGKIENAINTLAPYETAEDYDNVGLLIGKREAVVKNVLVTLDVTEQAVLEAVSKNANVIIAHHPLMFHARKRITDADAEARVLHMLIKHDIHVIAAHTNLDKTIHSGSACIAKELRLVNMEQDDFLFTGEFSKPVELSELEKTLEKMLHAKVRIYSPYKHFFIQKLSIVCGAGDEEYPLAMQKGAQALLTGEVRHHNAIAACMDNFILIDGTHYATERILVPYFAQTLQNLLNDIQSNVQFIASKSDLFLREDY